MHEAHALPRGSLYFHIAENQFATGAAGGFEQACQQSAA